MTPPVPLILVEDDDALRLATTQALELAGWEVLAFAEAEAALARITASYPGVVVTDIRMPRVDGLELLARVRAIDPDIPVILVTGHGDVPMAVAALRDGAFDFLTKPFATDHLAAAIRRALERRGLIMENRRLRAAAEQGEAEGPMLGGSDAVVRLRAAIRHLAQADLDVLVEGETGTGKELVATMLHRQGPRRDRPIVAVSCSALSADQADIELFGHAADSVGHTRLSRTGQIAASSGGTLLLDDIDGMALALQAKLLRVLEEREVQPIGAARPQPVRLRVVATSKVDLGEAVANGAFRSDLYYRLSLTRLRVPPLRERGDDIGLLFASLAQEAREQLGRRDWVPDALVDRWLLAHDWPGNVRELRNFTYKAVLGTERETQPDAAAPPSSLPARMAAFEIAAIERALLDCGGSVQAAVGMLGIPRKTFYDKVERHGIDLKRFRP